MACHGPSHLLPESPPSVIKSELVQKLHAKCPHSYQRDLERVVGVVLEEIIGALKQGECVERRGL